MSRIAALLLGTFGALVLPGCGQQCGPSRGVVASALDGDTVRLESGEVVRYLMVDTPEITDDECWSQEAWNFNKQSVVGREIELTYDVECTDNRDRLLAYVSVGGRELNTRMVELGHACVLHLSPNGDDRVEEFEALETAARNGSSGLWACSTRPTCAR